MDPAQVIEELGVPGRLPVEAIRAAQADRATMVPVFLRTLDDFLSLEGPANPDALFFIFHLLGEWREKSAYWPLAVFLRLPPDVLDSILGDAITDDEPSRDGGGFRRRSRTAVRDHSGS